MKTIDYLESRDKSQMYEFSFGQFVFAYNPVCTKIKSANLWNLKSPYVFSVNSVVSKDNITEFILEWKEAKTRKSIV